MLLSRLEDEKTGKIIPKDFYVDIPKLREQQAQACAEILGKVVYSEFPFLSVSIFCLVSHTFRMQNL